MSLKSIIAASDIELPAPPARTAASAFVDLLVKNPLTGALDGLNAGIEKVRAEPSAVLKKEEIVRNLLELELTKNLREKLLPRLVASQFRLVDECRAEHPYGTHPHLYTALQGNDTEVALVHLPSGVFDRNASGYELYVSDFAHMLKAFRGRTIRLFSDGFQGVTYAFEVALDDEKRGSNWRFVQWSNVEALSEGRLAVWQAFSLANPGAVPNHATALPKKVGDAQVEKIVDVLRRFVMNEKPSVEAAFKTLVSESGWPAEWKEAQLTGWKGVAQTDARDFVAYMTGKSTFPIGHENAGRSVIGEFLRKFLARGVLGGEDAETLARIMVDCTLVPDADTFKKYLK